MFTQGASFRLLSLVIGTWIAGAATPIGVVAQIKHYRTTPRVESFKVLARLDQGNIPSRDIRSAFEADGFIDDSTMYQGNYDRYTDAERQQFLDGLERIAREGMLAGDFDAMTDAFSALYFIATSPYRTGPQVEEIPTRLMRIYEQTTIRESKWSAISNLGQILRMSPKESPDIIRLLASLIKQPVTTQETIEGTKQYATQPVEPAYALDALFDACNAAVPALRQLYTDRAAIPHTETRARIEGVASEGFDPNSFELSTGWPQPCIDVPPHLQGR